MVVVRVLILGSAMSLMAAPAFAADVGEAPLYTAPPATTYESGFDWSGPYLGVLAGYGFGDFDSGSNVDGLLGGVYGGFNHQFGSAVYGLELDGVVSGADGSSGNVDWLSTARIRAGHTRDNMLFYGTGGLAVAGASVAGDDQTHLGWTLGAGVEAALTDRITGRFEYQYTNLNDQNYATTTTGFDMHAVRVGLGLQF